MRNTILTAEAMAAPITQESKIQKTRLLPLKGKLLVSTGDAVTPETVVAATELPGNVQMVNVAGQLNVDPGDVKESMLRTEGDHVSKGEPLDEFGFVQAGHDFGGGVTRVGHRHPPMAVKPAQK